VPGYTFDKSRADRVVKFIETFCVMSKGEWAGKPMKLQPWQIHDIIEPMFGWVDSTGARRYRTSAIFTPKKNGKSTLLSALALYFLIGDGEQGAEVWGAACDRAQAGIIFREAAAMVRASPSLSRVIEIIDSTKTLVHKASNSRYSVLSSDSWRAEGINASAVLLDETHSQRDRRLYDALRYAGAARRQPMLCSISTAGYDRTPSAIWWELWQYSERVGLDPKSDPTFFGKIYSASIDDDYWDKKTWYKANPSLGKCISLRSFRADAVEAKNSSSKLNAWLRYRLNVPTQSDTRWFQPEDWAACNGTPLEPLHGRACFAGIDMADNLDITAVVYSFPSVDGSYDLDCRFFVPEDGVAEREKKDNIPYSQWIRDGWITTTDGARLDHERLGAEIIEYSARHNIRKIGVDPFNIGSVATQLQRAGLEVQTIGQSIGSLTSPSKLLEGLVASKKIRHGGNPVLAWMAGNVQVTTDSSGNIKPDKAKSTEKIDGIVATILGLALASTSDESLTNVWEIHAI